MGIARQRQEPGVRALSRRALTWLALAALLPGVARADGETVPLSLQAKLCAKVVQYDRNFRRRAGDRVRIIVLYDSKLADSRHAAFALKYAFDELGDIAGLPVSPLLVEFHDAVGLRNKVDSESAAILYLTPGLGAQVAAISGVLAGANVLSVSALSDDVKNGIVLGFDLVSSQPKLWVNLSAAQRQNVAFESQALKLMKVFR
jgi:hypothetical protein